MHLVTETQQSSQQNPLQPHSNDAVGAQQSSERSSQWPTRDEEVEPQRPHQGLSPRHQARRPDRRERSSSPWRSVSPRRQVSPDRVAHGWTAPRRRSVSPRESASGRHHAEWARSQPHWQPPPMQPPSTGPPWPGYPYTPVYSILGGWTDSGMRRESNNRCPPA